MKGIVMVCATKPRKEFHDLIADLKDIVDEADSRGCDIVRGKVAAEMSFLSKELYFLTNKGSMEDEWSFDPDPLWFTQLIFGSVFALGFSLGWVLAIYF